MPNSLKMHTGNALKVAITFTPWLISMYILYWLEYGEVWTTETAYRGMASVAILVAGMGLSFLVRSRLTKREQK
jgi:hypothetical protein